MCGGRSEQSGESFLSISKTRFAGENKNPFETQRGRENTPVFLSTSLVRLPGMISPFRRRHVAGPPGEGRVHSRRRRHRKTWQPVRSEAPANRSDRTFRHHHRFSEAFGFQRLASPSGSKVEGARLEQALNRTHPAPSRRTCPDAVLTGPVASTAAPQNLLDARGSGSPKAGKPRQRTRTARPRDRKPGRLTRRAPS